MRAHPGIGGLCIERAYRVGFRSFQATRREPRLTLRRWHRKRTTRAPFIDQLIEARKLCPLGARQRIQWLQPFVPSAMLKQALLRRMTERAFIPAAVRIEDAKFAHQLTHEQRIGSRYREIMCAPRKSTSTVFTRSGVAAGRVGKLQQQPVTQSRRIQPPPRRQPPDTTSNDGHRNATLFARTRQRRTITQRVPQRAVVVYETPGDRGAGLAGQANQCGRRRKDAKKVASGKRLHATRLASTITG